MNNIAKILLNDSNGDKYNDLNNDIFIGEQFQKFIQSNSGMTENEKSNFTESTHRILSNCVPSEYNRNIPNSNTGLVFGYVQSGKTMSFTGVIALAKDNNYKLIIVLAGTTRILLDQTISRLKNDLNDRNSFEIIGEDSFSKPDLIAQKITNPTRNRTVIITILKHHKHIKDLTNTLSNSEILKALRNKSVLIIDDEADQASLNGFARKNWTLEKKATNSEDEKQEIKALKEFTTTYNNIINLKNILESHSYIQYTATPQANILAAQRDLLKPGWAVVLEPGEKYTGGNVFFKENSELIIEIQTEDNEEDPEMPDELQDAFYFFILESAILAYDEIQYPNSKRLRKKMKRTSMMVHADRLIETNSVYRRWLEALSSSTRTALKFKESEILTTLKSHYDKVEQILNEYISPFPAFNLVLNVIEYYVLEDLIFWFVAGDGVNQVQWDASNHHVLIGGQKLDRGFTVNELIVTYLPRQTKSISNADTIEQRCRFFGYKKDYIEACRVYLPEQSIEEFKEYVRHEEKLRKVLKEGSISDYYDNDILMRIVGLNPTSLNKIPGNLIRTDFFNYRFLQPDPQNFRNNNLLIKEFIEQSKKRGELAHSNQNLDNIHFVYNNNIQRLKCLINKIDINNKKDKVIINQFKSLIEDLPEDDRVWIIEMAYKRQFRPRSINESGELLALFTNHPPEFGDTKLLMSPVSGGTFFNEYNSEIIIQIHNIGVKPKDSLKEKGYLNDYSNNNFYILAFRYPNINSANYIQLIV